MQRRESAEARRDGRMPQVLHDWDFLLGVQDETRMGALRFRAAGSAPPERWRRAAVGSAALCGDRKEQEPIVLFRLRRAETFEPERL